ncbi:MAG: hypothetical protein COA94_05470 [Rickettsiales bacterium]|nr:MAG: hypothetical protein COA94_05470 [Rickettsiales bacterium]
MKKFTINCDFNGQMAPFAIYIGTPEKVHHPLHFQADWLMKVRGGTIPADVMDAVTQLNELAKKNSVPLEELCVYALGSESGNVLKSELEPAEASLPKKPSPELKPDAEALNKPKSQQEPQAKEQSESKEPPPDKAPTPEKHETNTHNQRNASEDAEDMSSEGGHVEDDSSDSGKLK